MPQLYVSMRGTGVVRSDKELKAFKRVTLAPGEKLTLTFRVPWGRLAYYGKGHKRLIEAENLDVLIGPSANEIAISRVITLEEGWEDPVLRPPPRPSLSLSC